MSFTLGEFVVEGVLREALRELQDDVNLGDTLEDVFGILLNTVLRTKYGQKQIDDLTLYLKKAQVSIVGAFPNSGDTKLPQISINLQGEVEAEDLATLYDFPSDEQEDIIPETIVETFTATSYDPLTGFVLVADGVDLSSVRFNRYYVDGNGTSSQILTPVSDDLGEKKFTIAKGLEGVNLVGGKIVSAINVRSFLTQTIPSREKLLIGIHTENSTLTKLLYHLTKFILYRRKIQLEGYGIKIATFDGSDFQQALEFLPDHIYSRFLTISYISYNTYRREEIELLDNTKAKVFVDKDEFDRNDDLEETIEVK